MSNADKIKLLERQRDAALAARADAINQRIGDRRLAAGCASSQVLCSMWSDEDWQSYHEVHRPYNKKIRELGGIPWRQSAGPNHIALNR